LTTESQGGTSLPSRPIEVLFPIVEINKIAEKESTGFGRRHYRPVYVIHKWWARRLGSIFRAILLYSLADRKLTEWNQDPSDLWAFYSRDTHLGGKVVLDPMMGGGTTVVEALRLGCKVIGGDLNPVSWFVVKKEIEQIDTTALRDSLVRLDNDLGSELRKYYRTTCPECGGSAEAIYYFHCKELECANCGSKISLMRDFFLAKSSRGTGDIVVCPNCWSVFETADASAPARCAKCGTRFTARRISFTSGQEFLCPKPDCRPTRIVEAIRRRGRPKERMYAIEFYCSVCDQTDNPRLMHGRGYKAPDAADQKLLKEAEREFESEADRLPIPDVFIPQGVETRRALNHGYVRFNDLFNARQLLNLGKIYRWILSVEDWNLKEFLVLAFSNCLKYNNMLCKYNGTRGFITDIFRTHSYSPSMTPVEGNCYDTAKGRGPFTAFVRLVIEGKDYCAAPFERIVEGATMKTVHFSTPIKGELALDYDDLQRNKQAMLICGSSVNIAIPDGAVDAVVTDPPYAGNVMYSELSNFFYVWLRMALRSKYPWFESETVPWEEEVISNKAQQKGEKEFLRGLTGVFAEANRILKSDGVLVFTFHHRNLNEWVSVLQAVLDSGFSVTAAYPVRSEMEASTHLRLTNSIKYDIILVCRKREMKGYSKSWSSVRKSIDRASKEVVAMLKTRGEKPTPLEIYVMTLGKCLECYSKYYPNVFHDGKIVTAEEALSRISATTELTTPRNRPQRNLET
jgi:adenine-specific DNA methylase